MPHPDPERFDAFYATTRNRLLLQAYALTGDLQAAHDGVRDGFVIAWHHWRKAQVDDPEAWVRPVAFQHAQRRARARVLHRHKPADSDEAATLEALHSLPDEQRRMLVLNHLAQGSLPAFAREVGLTDEQAARALQSGTAAFAVHRGVSSPMVSRSLDDLRASVDAERWPRATIIRRAGAARRRTHTITGAAAALAALLAGGAIATGPAQATLSAGGLEPTATASAPAASSGTLSPSTDPSEEAVEDPTLELRADDLLRPDQLQRLSPGRRWRATSTATGADGDGLALRCQQQRFADPDGSGTVIRTFEAAKAKRQPAMSAVQLTGLSASPAAARAAFGTTRDWFAGCLDTHMQLIGVQRVAGVGDEAALVTLRDWRGSGEIVVAGVARTGQLVTATTTTRAGSTPANTAADGALLAASVNALCGAPGAGSCAAPPTLRWAPLPAVGAAPGMLSEVDLPPATGVDAAWGGTQPRKAVQNLAATSCDRADFSSAPMFNALTRTFVVPRAQLPATFGLTETVGTMPERRAAAFVSTVRSRVARCEDDNLGTQVTSLLSRGDQQLWRFDIEVSDSAKQTVFMAIVRNRTAIAQIGFVPAPGATLSTPQLTQLVARAHERLAAMPEPAGSKTPGTRTQGGTTQGGKKSGNVKR